MNNTPLPQGVVIEIQAVDMTINEKLQRQIFRMLLKFKRYFSNINWADFYMRQSSEQTSLPRSIKVRLGIPGADIFASDAGKSWTDLMNSVEQKIIPQLKKRKLENSK